MSTPVTNDRVSLDIPDFVGHTKGWDGGVSFGNLEIFQFCSVMKQIDPNGQLRQQITDALNAAPGLRVAMMHGTFSRAPVVATAAE
ncbi:MULTISPECIES: hypothetical protein [unclassified Azospirillum]|uniref:hypothetical protein n=1 Tax=unclassified Azospirillum TaxID=2630922 RepID=UPI0011EDB63A|nr:MULTISPECIES: hypothetical protein [unclassified Azospirillum]KAA0572521.1 hypothetical protein FZ983_31745 [Azospirillum sp. B21]MDR6775501.1 hypothetical protein [Azospirillum sp. BE72]